MLREEPGWGMLGIMALVCRLQQKRPRLEKPSFSKGPSGSVGSQETFMRVLEGVGLQVKAKRD